jgi:hypothetical protein
MGTRPNFDSRELEYQYRRGAAGEQVEREYRKVQRKFSVAGMSTNPPDMLGEGEYPYLLNTRVYEQGRISSRAGQTQPYGALIGNSIVHSIKKLNDNITGASVRIIGCGGGLYVPDIDLNAKDNGYSGSPLSMVLFEPDNSPQSWMYVSDFNKMRKIRADGTNYGLGIAAPNVAPTATLGAPNISVLELFDAIGAWTVAGTAGALSIVARVNTTIGAIIYDTGATGWAIATLASMNQVGIGAVLRINTGGGTQEDVRVTATFRAIPATTISSIQYDAGVNGLCTIHAAVVVAGDTSTGSGGQASAVDSSSQRRIFNPRSSDREVGFLPLDPLFPDDGTSDSPTTGVNSNPTAPAATDPNALGLLPDMFLSLGGAAENVRVLSVTTGPDGTASFRCSTVNTHAAGDAITGNASIRAYFVNNHAAAETVKTDSFKSTVAAGSGYIQNVAAYNLGLVNGRATQPDDEIHISIRIDNLQNFVQGQIIFDVDGATHFTNNYYFNDFRANDLVSGVKASATMTAAQGIAYQAGFLDPRKYFKYAGLIWPIDQDLSFENDPSLLDAQDAAREASTTIDVVSTPYTGTGDSQWFEFRFKVSDLQRVGADTSKGLADVTGIRVVLQTSASADCQIDGLWIGGTFGPDIANGTPYNYRFRYRSTLTGARSNPSPPMRAGIAPHREQVALTGTQSPDAQVDKVDWYRWGGALTNWLYVGSSANAATPAFNDVYAEDEITSSVVLEFDNFQPFPSVDVPRSGTLDVAGTSLTWKTGDPFNVAWAPGTVININGRDYTLYAQPTSATRAQIVENGSTTAGAVWYIKTPVILGRPLPVIFGPYSNTMFAVGDSVQAGTLFWTNPNNPDCASDKNYVEVTPPSEPLQNGTMFDGRAMVGSTERWFAVIPKSDSTGFYAQELPVGHGLFATWGLAKDPNIDLVYFIAKDGIYVTNGGDGVCITDKISVLFPHDGQNGATTNGIIPPDFNVPERLRLSLCQGRLYFDYQDINGNQGCLVYNIAMKGWESLDLYGAPVYVHYTDEGKTQKTLVMGGNSGRIHLLNGTTDFGGAGIPLWVIGPQAEGDDARAQKVIGDGMLDFDSAGQSLTVTLETNWRTATPAAAFPTLRAGRGQKVLEWITGQPPGTDLFAATFGLSIFSAGITSAVQLFGWEVAWIPKTSTTGLRATDWTDEGYQGAKFFQGLILEADTGGVDKEFSIVDSDTGAVMETFTANLARQGMQPFSFAVPFISHKVKLVPTGQTAWRIYNVRYVYEPSPEAATKWITQGTTHDLKGFQHLQSAYLALMSNAVVTLTINVDGVNHAFNIATTGGLYKKIYLVLDVCKGKLFTYSLTSAQPFRLFERDCEVRVKQWNDAGPYEPANPFGDIHRISGARI